MLDFGLVLDRLAPTHSSVQRNVNHELVKIRIFGTIQIHASPISMAGYASIYQNEYMET